MTDETKKKDIWDILQVAGGLIGSVLIPVALWMASSSLSESVQESETKGKNVELAIDVLKQDPQKSAEVPGLREWAVATLKESLGLPENAADSLLRGKLLPGENICCVECDGKMVCGYSVDTPCGSCSVGPASSQGVGP